MKCESCNVDVGKKYAFAISQNKCPACGKQICKVSQPDIYLELCSLFKNIIQKNKAEKIANIVVSNFKLVRVGGKDTSIASQNSPATQEQPKYEIYGAKGSGFYKGENPDIQIYTPEQTNGGAGTIQTEESIEPTEKEVAEARGVMMETGIVPTSVDKNQARAMLQKMRDEALQGALDDRYGDDGDQDEVILAEDPVANVKLLEREQKRMDAREAVSNGLGKSGFRRSNQ